jgi:hypothetical protein
MGAGAPCRRSVHKCERGYSPTLRLWYRSLIIIDDPCFKFYATLLGSLELLFLLLSYASTFKFDSEEE